MGMSEHTLQFPKKLAPEIGLAPNEINNFKRKGCRFYGKKTCVAWVREYLDRVTAAESSTEQPARLQHSAGNKFCG
jgi:hypothetical protein